MAFFNRITLGRLISRVTSDVDAVRIGVQDVLFVSTVRDLLGTALTPADSFPPDGGGIGAGAAEIDLRYLTSRRVLVLVDGRRWVRGSSASGVSGAVDLNTIPTAAIERMEVLQDGASPIYGSDAIAGVVNIITRSDYRGFDLETNQGAYDEGDGYSEGAGFYGFDAVEFVDDDPVGRTLARRVVVASHDPLDRDCPTLDTLVPQSTMLTRQKTSGRAAPASRLSSPSPPHPSLPTDTTCTRTRSSRVGFLGLAMRYRRTKK